VLKNLTQAGLDVTVLASTPKTHDKVILLLNATKQRLMLELTRLNSERDAYSNGREMRRQLEEWNSDENNDDLQSNRPAWHRLDPERGKVNGDELYDAHKWEAERLMSYADEMHCIARIIRGDVAQMTSGDAEGGEAVNDPLSTVFIGAGIGQFAIIHLSTFWFIFS
jgi:hypothetical protein